MWMQHDTWHLYVTGPFHMQPPLHPVPADTHSEWLTCTTEACSNITVGCVEPSSSYLVDVKTPNTNRPLGWSVSSKNTFSERGEHTQTNAHMWRVRCAILFINPTTPTSFLYRPGPAGRSAKAGMHAGINNSTCWQMWSGDPEWKKRGLRLWELMFAVFIAGIKCSWTNTRKP